MSTKPENTAAAGLVKRLVNETGITEQQAQFLVTALGFDWSSLLREARILKPKNPVA